MQMRRFVNAIPPASMTPAERRTELCAMLAAGLLRLRLRHSDLPETQGAKREGSTTHSRRTERYSGNPVGEAHEA